MKQIHTVSTILPALVAVGVLLALATGCANPRVLNQSDIALHDARAAITQNRLDHAVSRLSEARRLAQQEGRSTRDTDLLLAEVHLRQGNTSDAISVAEAVAYRYPDDPRVHEVLGKALVQHGEFASATEHLQQAKAAYTSSEDTQRVQDLLHLVEGLAALADGRERLAEERWSNINDPALRRSLTRARRGLD